MLPLQCPDLDGHPRTYSPFPLTLLRKGRFVVFALLTDPTAVPPSTPYPLRSTPARSDSETGHLRQRPSPRYGPPTVPGTGVGAKRYTQRSFLDSHYSLSSTSTLLSPEKTSLLRD